jgi:glycosyltransferase 2 family protein
MRSGSRRILVTGALIVAGGAIIYRSRGILQLGNFSGERLLHAMAGVRIGLLVAALAVSYVGFLIRALRWQRFCRVFGPTRLMNIYTAVLMGFSAMFALGRAGEPIPPLLQARKNNLPVSNMFGLYVIERLFDLAGIGVMAALGLMYYPAALAAGGEGQAWLAKTRETGGLMLLGFAGVVALVIYFRLHGAGVLQRRLELWHRGTGWRPRVAGQFQGFSEGLQAIRTLSDLFIAVLYTGLHWLIFTLVCLLSLRAFGQPLASIGFAASLLILAFSMMGSALQLPGVGGGAQLAAFVVLTRMYAVPPEAAAAAAIILWLITFSAPCFAGVPLLIHAGWSMGDLRQMASAEKSAEDTGTHLTKVRKGATLGAGRGAGEAISPEPD